MILELICVAEGGRVVGTFETEGPTDAKTLRSGYVRVDEVRAPFHNLIKDGVQLTCGRCHDPLYFRAGDEEHYAAMPGSVRVE